MVGMLRLHGDKSENKLLPRQTSETRPRGKKGLDKANPFIPQTQDDYWNPQRGQAKSH